MAQTKYGQITPPEDNWKADWDAHGQPGTLDLTQTSDRHGSESSSSAAAGPQPSSSGGRVDKRDKYREKNRVAAAKCRAKKKEHVDGLEENHRTQSMLNALLKQTEQNLRDELSYWRTQALQHAFCDCHAVQDYNMRKARAIAADQDFGNNEMLRRDSIASPGSNADLSALHQGPSDFELQSAHG